MSRKIKELKIKNLTVYLVEQVLPDGPYRT